MKRKRQFLFFVSDDEYESLVKLAQAQDRSKSAVIRQLIMQAQRQGTMPVPEHQQAEATNAHQTAG